MLFNQAAPFTAGNFLITPLAQASARGSFTASLSVRQQQDALTLDAIYPFQLEFATRDSALMYATVQGRYWLINPMALA